jgi:hypothetical protein
MWEEILNLVWVKLGLLGLIILSLIALVITMDKRYNRRVQEHKEERAEFMGQLGKQHKENLEMQKETNKSINNFSQAIYEMKGMIRIKK